VLFYNRQTKTPGILTRYDLLVLDEAQSIRFTSETEIQAQLKGYLEQGVYSRGDCHATAEGGLMLLANIDLHQHPTRKYHNGKAAFVPARGDFIRKLPKAFLEPPLVDRFHGIIPGWEIPPFQVEQQARGYGLKADFFAEVCHTLRAASHFAQRVRAKLRLSGYKRDCTGIERLACGLSKLLLIEPDDPRFDELVIAPAEAMRRIVRTQLNELDPQTYAPGLDIKRIRSADALKDSLGRVMHYELLQEIGCGGMAQVYRGLDTKRNDIVAIKMVRTQGMQVDEAAIRREIDIYTKLQQFGDPHILKVMDIFRDNDKYVLVTEYADGGSLWDLLGGDMPDEDRKPLDENTTKDIALALLDGLIALHNNEIVHRDIKPANILRCDDTWKIADFGISKKMNKPVTGHTFQGAHSAPWAPPEQTEGAQAHPSADIYAFARVVSFLLTGSKKRADIDLLAQHWADLLSPCLVEDPEQRPTALSLREGVYNIPV